MGFISKFKSNAPKFRLNLSLDINLYQNTKLNKNFLKGISKMKGIDKRQINLTQNVLYELLSTERISYYGLVLNLHFNYIDNTKKRMNEAIKKTMFEDALPSKVKLICKKDYVNFWKKCEQKSPFSSYNGVSHEFKDLFEKMVCYRPKERININEIKKHSWLKELFKNLGDLDQEENIEFNNKNNNSNDNKKLFSPKKNKVKHLSHNPSFNKKDKNYNNMEKKSNYSDGLLANENNLLHINNNMQGDHDKENHQKTFLNNKQKEFEMKYLKELSLRKANIDKQLKEQDDDVD